MKKRDIETALAAIEADQEKAVNDLVLNPAKAVKVMHIKRKTLEFGRDNLFDRKGAAIKVSFWKILFNQTVRRFLLELIKDLLDLDND